MTQYHPLSELDAITYAKNLPNIFDNDAQLTCHEIGDGNLNLVFHITDTKSAKGVIIKQALPYAKVVGESWPLTLDRARIESEALIAQAQVCPTLVPEVYAYDPNLAVTAMEDLSDHIIMRKGLMQTVRYPRFAEDIGTFLARTLFYTSDLGMNQQDKKRQVENFINPDLCKITEDLIFEAPYTDADTNNYEAHLQDVVDRLHNNVNLHLEVAILRQKFLTSAQALLHGDLHTGSIFVTPESTKVIDPEFAYYGPMGFDIGAVFANLLLNYAAQEAWSESPEACQDYRNYLLNTLTEVWNVFNREFRALWNEHCVDRIAKTTGYQDFYMQQLLRDTVGFTGCKMVRRVIGLAHVADIDQIENLDTRERAQRIALHLGQQLILLNRQAASIDDLIDLALKCMILEEAVS
ncbi:S-methyl-5-thioribose kinase [Paenibacillus sp. N1-5-1-14]|uniref:S-methyl-5-thioribose kinase n=1 Tax=Paenibacillus radicibacter TaxID=2972488 RepID=UPI0021590809|nr:S-methyl-5-thioribose kinase [Paenibacillus radicibacter]MCR8643669.1 S-methyl-5-thioribose kinase [Paenibacillus radicibacter]